MNLDWYYILLVPVYYQLFQSWIYLFNANERQWIFQLLHQALWLLASLWDTNPFVHFETSDVLSNSTIFNKEICDHDGWMFVSSICIWIFVFDNMMTGKRICLVAWSTWTWWQIGTWWSTGTWWQTWTWWSTGTWVILTGEQQYPSWTIDLSVNKSTPIVGEILQRTLDRSYTNRAPQYPEWTPDFFPLIFQLVFHLCHDRIVCYEMVFFSDMM